MSRIRPSEVRPLRDLHGGKAKPGYSVFVADRGALRIDIPEGWFWSQDADSFKFFDREPPADRCTLACSLWRLGERLGRLARQFPLGPLVTAALKDGDRDRKPVSVSDVREERRGGLDLAWAEMRFIDPGEQREAVARLCIARERALQALLTLDFWPEHAPWVDPAWGEALASLELDRPIADPSSGPLVH